MVMNTRPSLRLCYGISVFIVVAAGFALPVAFAEETSVSNQEGEVSVPTPKKAVPVLHFKGGLPQELPIPGDPRPYANSPYATRIDKALAFLAFKDRDSNRNYRLVLLDYMQRKYGLHERYSLKATRAPHLAEASSEDLGHLKRLTDPEYKVALSVIEEASPFERLVLKALYCDVYPAEISFLDEMNTMIQEGMSPFLPTLAIAYLWLYDHRCFFGEPKLMLVRDALAVKFRNHLRDNGLNAPMSGQAMALLFEIGHGDMVEEDWLTTAAKAQNEDGSWDAALGGEGTGKVNGMTTTHMLWALLEHAQPHAPDTAMIRPGAPPAKSE